MVKLWGWDKKPRTMLRSIKIGDIFCFRYDKYTFCFGQIIGYYHCYISKIFAYTSDTPVINEDIILNTGRLKDLMPIDAYSLFDKRLAGEWRIIGHQDDYAPTDEKDYYFTWGIGSDLKKSNLSGNTFPISEDEAQSLPNLSPHGDEGVQFDIVNDIYEKYLSQGELKRFIDFVEKYDDHAWYHKYLWTKAYAYAIHHDSDDAERVVKEYYSSDKYAHQAEKIIEMLREISTG